VLTSVPFSSRLRTATTSDHHEAELSGFMAALMAGRANQSTYAALVVQLQPIYLALDTAAAAHRGDPVFGPFFDPRLSRAQALQSDLAYLDTAHMVTPATRSYCQRMTEVADDALLVLAHHYTRYLGDLSGGRAIAARLAATLGLTSTQGLAFYQFDIGAAPVFKNAYRSRLDDLRLPMGDEARFIAEVSTAYTHNRQVLASLDDLL